MVGKLAWERNRKRQPCGGVEQFYQDGPARARTHDLHQCQTSRRCASETRTQRSCSPLASHKWQVDLVVHIHDIRLRIGIGPELEYPLPRFLTYLPAQDQPIGGANRDLSLILRANGSQDDLRKSG
jgi:hypothetical protein